MSEQRAKLLSGGACLLIALAPAIQLMAANPLVVLTDAARWMLGAGLGAAALALLALLSRRHGLARCNAVAVALLAVFYGGLIIHKVALLQTPATGWIVALGFVAGLAAVILLLRRLNQARVTLILAAWSAAMTVMGLAYWVTLGSFRIDVEPVRAADRPPIPELEAALGAAHTDAGFPDILYIVPDRYTSNRVLAERFGYDNRWFHDELRKRGFAIAAEARSNHPHTPMSLASALNMQPLTHLDTHLAGEWGVPETRSLFQDNLTQETLRRLGYRHVHTGTWWLMTVRNRNAEVNVSGSAWMLNEFERMMIQRTPLWPLITFLGSRGLIAHPECARLRSQVAFLTKVGAGARPIFTFAHLFMPHHPRVMDADGACIWPLAYDIRTDNWEPFAETYIEFLKHTNVALLEIIDAQLARHDGNVVIVIQSDEGPWPRQMWRTDGEMSYGPENAADMRMKFGILNAIYLPGGADIRLDADSSPVNNMRIVLSQILGVALPLLPNRSYTLVPGESGYAFRDVTEILAGHSNR